MLRQIDGLCDQFESALAAGQDPPIDAFLDQVEEPARPRLLHYLEELKIRYRDKAGDTAPVALREPSAETSKLAAPQPVGAAGRNLLYGEIGCGGMGAVMRGRDPVLGREVAVKMLLKKHSKSAELAGRFVEEAQITGQLQHPGIVPVYEFGRLDDNRPFFTMKLVKGQTLETLLDQRADPRDSLPRFLTIFEHICQAVAYAHARDVIHRDLKPLNIMVGNYGEVQVMDWGLVKVLSRPASPPESQPPAKGVTNIRTVPSGPETGEERAGTLLGMGSYGYMPPEQALGEADQIDERADIFALGAILCVILTGQPPYVGTKQEVVRQTSRGDLAAAYSRLDASGADAELVRLAKHCLALRLEDRPRHAGEVAAALTGYLAGVQERLKEAEITRAAALVRAAEEHKRRRLTVALAAAVLALFVAGGGGWWWVKSAEDARTAEQAKARSAAERRVRDAVREASQFRRQGLEQMNDLDRWGLILRSGLAALQPAEQQLADATDLEDDLRRESAAVRAELMSDDRDRRLLARLDAVRLQKEIEPSGHFAQHSLHGFRGKVYPAAAEYAAAFAEYGVPVDTLATADAVARITGRPAAPLIAVGIEDWAHEVGAEKVKKHLTTVVDRLDPDPWRARVRDAWGRDDSEELARLAAEADVMTLPVRSIEQLASALFGRHSDRAVALLRSARFHHPRDFWVHYKLARFLHLRVVLKMCGPQEQYEVGQAYAVAASLRPTSVGVLSNLASFLEEAGDREGQLFVLRECIRLLPRDPDLRRNLGIAFIERKRYSDARRELEEAVRLQPDSWKSHVELGRVYRYTKELDKAESAAREAILLEPGAGVAYNLLGTVFSDRGRNEDDITEYRKALEAESSAPVALENWVRRLQELGRYAAAVEVLKKHKAPEAEVREAERLVKLDAALKATDHRPQGNAADLVALAEFAHAQKARYATAAKLYKEAFAAERKLAEPEAASTDHQYNAACAAARAAAGNGPEGKSLSAAERAAWRKQALEWLTASLDHWKRQAQGRYMEQRIEALNMLELWEKDSDLTAVREDALGKLQPDEQKAWQKLWLEVRAVAKPLRETLSRNVKIGTPER
jgi:serine/threonine-protein kinase